MPLSLIALRIRDCHPLRSVFPGSSAHAQNTMSWSYNPADASPQQRFGLFPVRSPLLGESLLFSLPGGTKMFQFPPFASLLVVRIITLQVIGLSHSEIAGSRVICTYPALIAAYHVLHRLREPRHPPDALALFRLTRHATANRDAHTFSCKLRFIVSQCITDKIVFTYSLVCQYVKELLPQKGV